MNREAWLQQATQALQEDFTAQGSPIPPNVRVSCGFSGARGGNAKKEIVGGCWSASKSADKHFEIFVSPTQSDSLEVLGILVHELVHATVGVKAGHKGPFKRLATALGLEGKMTSTTTGERLKERLNSIIEQIGAYPHASLDASLSKKQSTRMIKIECVDCSWTARTSRKMVDAGLPTCFCGGEIGVTV